MAALATRWSVRPADSHCGRCWKPWPADRIVWGSEAGADPLFTHKGRMRAAQQMEAASVSTCNQANRLPVSNAW